MIKTHETSPILELFQSAISNSGNKELMSRALKEDPILATKVVFHIRDVRSGEGRRDIVKTLFSEIHNKEVAIELLKYLPEIGRWKDVYDLYGTNKELDNPIEMMTIVALGLYNNIDGVATQQPDTLACKWFPRQSALHKAISKEVMMDMGELRRHVAKNSSTVEQKMCMKKWSEINYSQVPSIANTKYIGAFLRNDEDRRRDFLAEVVNGTKTVNSSVTYPHDILRQMPRIGGSHSFRYDCTGSDQSLAVNALWKGLPDFTGDGTNTVMPVIDTSGSMTRKAVGANCSCMEIALSLGIYMAERNKGDLKDLWINFSLSPNLYRLEEGNLNNKLSSIDYNNWNQSTNLDATLDLLARAAKIDIKNNVDTIVIVSDMAFNGRSVRFDDPKSAKKKFEDMGLTMPHIVFWRVDQGGNSNVPPMSEEGITVINGYSPKILKDIMSGSLKSKTPYESMLEIVEPKYTYLKDVYTNLKGNI